MGILKDKYFIGWGRLWEGGGEKKEKGKNKVCGDKIRRDLRGVGNLR